MKNYCLISIYVFIVIFTLIGNFAFSQEDKNTSNTDATTDIGEEELDKLEESNITTKIYQGADSSNDVTEKESSLDFVIQDDVITKDELLNKSKNKNRNKIYKREKNLTVQESKTSKSRFVILPWIVLFGLIVSLGVIFNVLIKKKI